MVAMLKLRSLALDVEPLRHHRDFRLLLGGQAINNIGSMFTPVALSYQLYVLTHSALALGTMAAAQLIAVLLFSPLAGSIADAVDRRRLLLVTQAALCAISATLAILAFTGLAAAWHIYLLAFLQSIFDATDRPARQSMIPRLVSRERLAPAIALNRATMSLARVAGPALSGTLIASVGLTAAYGVDAVTFVASFASLALIAKVPPAAEAKRPGWSAIKEGFDYVRRTPVVFSAFIIDLDAMVFGMPTSLFPILALDVFHVGAVGLGLLTAAPSFGGIVGLVTSGWIGHTRWHGRVVIASVAIWGLSIALFGLAPTLPLALALLVIAGGSDVISAIVRATMIQVMTPDRLRGRVTALNSMAVGSGPKLGAVESTSVAAFSSAQFSVISGGLLCLAGLVFVIRYCPRFLAYDTATAAPEEAEPEAPAAMPPGIVVAKA
jgi:MFS family permease